MKYFIEGARNPWWWVVVWALCTLAGAPFMGLVRDALLNRFPGATLRALVAGIGVLVAAAILGAVWGALRRSGAWDHRRWLWLGLAVAVLAAQLLGFRTDVLSVDVVEKVHVVQYGLLAFLASLGVRGSSVKTGRLDPEVDRPGLEHLLLPIFLGTTVGALDESIQGFFQLRTGDIRDVALNGLASVTGACFAVAVAPGRSMSLGLPWPQRRWVAQAAGMTLWVVAGFFSQAHLGYDIHDPKIGQFRSWFTVEELSDLAAQRQEEWGRNPPTGLEAWAPEDYFLTEAAWHANHRNERLQAQDWTMALQANRILEAYYDPFLDLESFRGSGKHRWRPELVAQVERDALDLDPGLYVSPVLLQRIYPWSKARFFMGLLIATACLAALGYRWR